MEDYGRELAKRVMEDYWQAQQMRLCIPVRGSSMGATIPEGASVQVFFSRRLQLARNKIVYIRRGRRRIVHRLKAHIGPFCLEQGDALRLPRFCWRSAILGVVECIVLQGFVDKPA